MARRPRLDCEGAWHHVMNRGIARRPIFEGRGDIRFFLSRVARAVRRGELEVHAYCVLPTHFHMLVRSPAGLSPALWLAGVGGVAFSAFAFFGLGWTPFFWALGLGLAGVPVYLWMRWRHPAQASPGTA